MQLLKKAGLGKDDVTLVNLRPQDMVAALASGSIDAYGTWEPHIYNGIKALGAKAAPLDTKGIYAETFNIVVMQDYLQKKPDVVTSFLKSLVEAEAWIKANPDEAMKIVAEFVKMPVDDLKPIWDDYVYQVALDDQVARRPQCACRLAAGHRQSSARRHDAGLAHGHLSRAAEIGRAGQGDDPGIDAGTDAHANRRWDAASKWIETARAVGLDPAVSAGLAGASTSGYVNELLFPPPTKVAVALWDELINGTLLLDLGMSVTRVVIGFVGGAATGDRRRTADRPLRARSRTCSRRSSSCCARFHRSPSCRSSFCGSACRNGANGSSYSGASSSRSGSRRISASSAPIRR